MTRRCCRSSPSLALCAAVSAAFATGCSAPERPRPAAEDPSTKPAAPVAERLVRVAPAALAGLALELGRVKRREVRDEVSTFLAETRLRDDAATDVVAPARGVLERLGPATTERVKKGRLLAVLRSAEVGRARASVRVARVRARQAAQQSTRAHKLFEAGVGPKREAEVAATELAIANAKVDEALAYLAALGVGSAVPSELGALARVRIVAPRAGTIVERPVRVGAAVESGALLYRLADLSRVWLVARLGEVDAASVHEGAPVRVRFAAYPGEAFAGEVARRTGVVDPRSRTVELRLRIVDPARRLRPGMAATVHLATGPRADSALVVPSVALTRLNGAWWVFMPRGEGVFVQRQVTRRRSIDTDVEIVGLREGDAVVTEGAFFLRTEATRVREAEQ